MMLSLVLAATVGAESALLARVPEIVARSAAHYRALDAAATPLMRDAKGQTRMPKSWTPQRGLVMNRTTDWTCGHYAGSLWYLYEATGDAFFRDRAVVWTEILEHNKTRDNTHDLGFMMFCSFGNAARLLKTDRYDAVILESSASLEKRFHPRLGLIRSWGKVDEKKDFLVIPDNLMNLEMLAWAARHGDAKAGAIARAHADMTMKHHFRADGGCYHVLDYDQERLCVQGIRRGQGMGPESAWSRGQSWAIYGYTLMYRETKEPRYLAFAQKLADYAIGHPNMPADGVPCWDYGAPGEERDTSAASVMASGLLELSTFVGGEKGAAYRAFAVKQISSLASPDYFAALGENGGFLLKHGVGHKPGRSEIDVPLNYGDYYFLEALVRLRALAAK